MTEFSRNPSPIHSGYALVANRHFRRWRIRQREGAASPLVR